MPHQASGLYPQFQPAHRTFLFAGQCIARGSNPSRRWTFDLYEFSNGTTIRNNRNQTTPIINGYNK